MRPAGASIGVGDPCLVRDEKRAPNEKQRPQGAERDVVLKKNIAPADTTKQRECAWSANDGKRSCGLPRRLSDNAHFMSHRHELPREQVRHGFNSAGAG